jgi:hypothetical protein
LGNGSERVREEESKMAFGDVDDRLGELGSAVKALADVAKKLADEAGVDVEDKHKLALSHLQAFDQKQQKAQGA